MQNPELANETTEEYAERMRKVATMMALPVGTREPGQITLAYYDYAKFAAELAAYRPRSNSQEVNPAAAVATVGADHTWCVTADLTEEQYLDRIWRPWRGAVKRGERA
jgi:hypothetical protein